MKKNQIIDVNYLTSKEINKIFTVFSFLKQADYENAVPELLKNQTLAMLFEEPSTRTRISFEAAMTKLGGHAQYLKPGEIHLGERESLYDTIKVFSRLTDGIFCRALKHETIEAIAKYSDVPVFNGLTDLNHPTQVIGDFFTMQEHFLKENKTWDQIKLVFIGDATNVCKSLMHLGTKLGINFVHIGPKKYQAKKNWIEQGEKNLKEAKSGSLLVTDDLNAVKGADFIYTDLWWWVDQIDEANERYQAFTEKNYQVNEEMLKIAGPNVKVMHCLPCSRNVELQNEVLDGKNSIVFNQAENKLYSAMALLTYFMYPRSQAENYLKIREYKLKINEFLQEEIAMSLPRKTWIYNNDYQFEMNYLKDLNLKKVKSKAKEEGHE